MRRTLLLIQFVILGLVVFSQEQPTGLKWYTLAEAQEMCKKQPKKILIDMYTDWCGWCKKMDAETFNNPAIASYITNYFYPVKFDAETHDTITFKEKKYVNKNTGKRSSHDLAIELLAGKMSYPTIVYLDENFDMLSPVGGYMSPRDIEPILMFFGRGIYKSNKFEDFKKNFDSTFSAKSIINPYEWTNVHEGLKTFEQKPKNMIIRLSADWCGECKIMDKTTFNDSIISAYLKANFYTIDFNILSKDTVVFNKNTFINEGKEHPFHQMAVNLLNGKMDVPAMVFINAKNELISVVPSYYSDQSIEPILHFFAEEKYKTTSWEKFIAGFKSSYNIVK